MSLEIKTQDLGHSIAEVKEKNDFINSLLKELNHRVKNNLQLVSSLLNMQESKLEGKGEKESINIARNRIIAIGLIHQKLYSGDSNLNILLNDYVKELCEYLIQSADSKIYIRFDLHPEPIYTNVETTVHIGLIVNELITNSLKHAWSPDTNKKSIFIKTLLNQKNKLILTVSDNGNGFYEEKTVKSNTSFGLQLINSIIEQYSGKIEIKNEKGSIIKISMII